MIVILLTFNRSSGPFPSQKNAHLRDAQMLIRGCLSFGHSTKVLGLCFTLPVTKNFITVCCGCCANSRSWLLWFGHSDEVLLHSASLFLSFEDTFARKSSPRVLWSNLWISSPLFSEGLCRLLLSVSWDC